LFGIVTTVVDNKENTRLLLEMRKNCWLIVLNLFKIQIYM